MAALIHDVGKIQIPAEILSKPGRLSQDEMALIRTHPEVGSNILVTFKSCGIMIFEPLRSGY